ncbi:MAG: hypothetical protein HY537_01800 [Deltaproteobacteria bacterium]|nr:hypothetical protein [Deltaproteobacteria bacterium]
MAGFVPIVLNKTAVPDYVLVDDDELVRMLWSMAADEAGKNLETFSDPDEFITFAPRLRRETTVYIDANLGSNISGETIARQAFDMGFENVYLATGYEATHYKHLTFLKGVCGKTPPWTV